MNWQDAAEISALTAPATGTKEFAKSFAFLMQAYNHFQIDHHESWCFICRRCTTYLRRTQKGRRPASRRVAKECAGIKTKTTKYWLNWTFKNWFAIANHFKWNPLLAWNCLRPCAPDFIGLRKTASRLLVTVAPKGDAGLASVIVLWGLHSFNASLHASMWNRRFYTASTLLRWQRLRR